MLGFSIPSLATRVASGAVPPLPPPASLTSIVLDGDSLTGAAVVGQDSGSWAWQYLALRPSGATAVVRAQGSRYTGALANLDDGSNTLFGKVTENITAHGGQLIWAGPFLTNDFGTGFHGAAGAARATNIKARLAEYWAQVKAKGVTFAFGFPPPLHTDGLFPGHAEWTASRTAFLTGFRDPAVWGLYCDYYIPVGEQPDFNAADNSALISGDKVHPTAAGQAKLLEANRAALDTLFDAQRASATTMYASAWPIGATGLATATPVVRRFVVSGLAHKGLALTGSNALSATGGAQVRVNGGAYAAAASGWLYNGDTVELRVTTSASADTPVSTDLKVGTETRTLTFRTAAAAAQAVDYVHGGGDGSAPYAAAHTYAAKSFSTVGLGIVGVTLSNTVSASVTVGGVAATPLFSQLAYAGGPRLEVFAIPITAAGAKTIQLDLGGFCKASAVVWGVLTGASATPASVLTGAVNGPNPHGVGGMTVPPGGLQLGFFLENGGAADPAPSVAGATLLGRGVVLEQGETFGVSIAERDTTGAIAWSFKFGQPAVVAGVFEPA